MSHFCLHASQKKISSFWLVYYYNEIYLRSVMEARVDNIIIPSRYMKGSLPGLDLLMEDLSVSSPIEQNEDFIIGINERPEIVNLENSPTHDTILLDANLVDGYNQFRVLKLSNGNFWIASKTDTTLFLTRSRDLEKIHGEEPLCNSSSTKLFEWRIEHVK
ncbi:hypothetical protein Anas_06559 [Armadillidium nasatum]|uniref:Uncharacterized protein n=1 Tax=Armadillidium nasatum TaxID=96803 RepID=A0A5N5SSR0_9CRUS|nr:hypothetical protein Anas_06559 [Armadillidium nasatum]